MSEVKKKNVWYWLGNAAVGLLGIGITYSDKIIGVSFPEHTAINQLAIPISLGLKYLWDIWRYRKGTISEHGKKLYDKIPNLLTGEYGKNLSSGLSRK